MNKNLLRFFISVSLVVLISNNGSASVLSSIENEADHVTPRKQVQSMNFKKARALFEDKGHVMAEGATLDHSAQKLYDQCDQLSSHLQSITLHQSLQLRTACEHLSSDLAVKLLNNLFTNMAYDRAVANYGNHRGRLLGPFTEDMSALYSAFISAVPSLRALLPGEALALLKSLNLNGSLPDLLHEKISKDDWLPGFLGVKWGSDFNRDQFIALHVLSPRLAYGVNQVNYGQLLSQHCFKKLNDALVSIQDDLAEKSKTRLADINEELAILTKSGLDANSASLKALQAEAQGITQALAYVADRAPQPLAPDQTITGQSIASLLPTMLGEKPVKSMLKNCPHVESFMAPEVGLQSLQKASTHEEVAKFVVKEGWNLVAQVSGSSAVKSLCDAVYSPVCRFFSWGFNKLVGG